jgi:hypothetical protein
MDAESKILIPTLTTSETRRLRSDYPSIEHLEAGNVAAWLVERQEQLLVRAKDERTGMNLAKLLTLAGGAVGAVCYATSPLAPIGALIAGVGYVWAVAQDLNDSHQFAPVPFVRGNFVEFLTAMGDKDAREEWFGNSNELVDLMFHLDPFERFEFGMLKEHAHVLSEYLTQVESGKKFYAYRWLFDWFVNLKGTFPSRDQLTSHLTHVTSDPRIDSRIVEAIREAQIPQRSVLGIPPTPVTELPQTPIAELPSTPTINFNEPGGAELEADAIETPAVEVTTPEVTPTVSTQPQVPQTQTSTKPTPQAPDIALEMAKVPKSTIIAASPRVGKGVVVSMAIANLKRLHPDLEIWLIDPKDEPTERHYWGLIDMDKRCHFDLRDFDVDVKEAIETFSDHIVRFNQSPSHRKLLIIDEFVTLSQKCKGEFMDKVKDFLVGICSSGEVNPDMGIGRFVWVITQSPYVTDLGFKTKAALATFQRVFLLNQASISLYALAVSASFVPGGNEDKIAKLMKVTGRVYYYSRSDSWHPIPKYTLSIPTSDTQLRAKLEGLISDVSDSPETISETPEMPPTVTETPETLKRIPETLKQAQDERFSDNDNVSFRRFTKLKLLFQDAKELVERLRNEMSQTKIIETLWDAKPGESKAYKDAISEYKTLTEEV